MHSAIKVAKHFVDRANEAGVTDMTPLKLMKITYIAHGWMLGVHQRPFFSEDVEAWQYGPVIPELYREAKKFGRGPVTHLPDEYDFELDADEESIIQQCLNNYGHATAGQLVALTHEKGTPWDVTVKKYGHGPGVTIANETIEAYYAELMENGS